jgi:DNA-binding NtrC family response regulator
MSDLTGPTQSLSAGAIPVEPVRLEVIDGPAKGACAPLEQGTVVAGSSSRADLRLDDPAVSRAHASFELVGGGVRVKDLNSRNGMLFLGAKVESALLPIGTSITLGRSVVRIAALQKAQQVSAHTEVAGVVAHSLAMRQLLWRIERVAASDATAVILGPTGAGKEVVARAIHQLSPRASARLEVFDCAAARPELLESELFGHVRGAFTGATGDRTGVIEAANRGTLVLDNVDQLPLDLQTRLLRFLEERVVRRVGAAQGKQVDVRVLATSQVDLEDAVSRGALRADIFYRLAQVVLEVPSLARRREDIPVLAARFALEVSNLKVALSKQTLAALQAHPWPGNARELKNAVARSLAFGTFEPADAPSSPAEAVIDLKDARAQVVKSFEADFLRALLQKHSWNVAAAAREAKIARSYLYTLLGRYQIKRD